MNKLFYPAIFHVAEEGGFWITFPDLPECMTQGDNMQEAYEMAVDALGLALTSRELEKQVIPAASELSQIAVNKDEYCVIIEFDMLAYKKRTNSKAVKKTSYFSITGERYATYYLRNYHRNFGVFHRSVRVLLLERNRLPPAPKAVLCERLVLLSFLPP